jgi:methylenetetrahydrofolate--tRNA-(uracil-5-)-methyltransferase
MHRNTFLHSPGMLDETYQVTNQPGLYFAGQMTGVEGYVESAASGLVAGISLACRMMGMDPPVFPRATALGAMALYVSTPNRDFQPMNCCFGLIESLPVEPGKKPIRNKVERYEAIGRRSLAIIRDLAAQMRDLGSKI